MEHDQKLQVPQDALFGMRPPHPSETESSPRGDTALSAGQCMVDPHADPRPLPASYDRTRLVVLVRDPEWIFAYWEISWEDRRRLGIENNGHGARFALRVHDVTGLQEENGSNRFHDVVVTQYADSWYLHVAAPNRAWRVELGLLDAEGRFICIARSNRVFTPPNAVSHASDDQWMEVDEQRFQEVFRLSGGDRKPSEVNGSEGLGVQVTQRILPQYLLGASEQFGLSSAQMASEQLAMRGGGESEKSAAPFWLQVDCELVIYGATEPDANVTLCGQPLRLRPDGTFSVRLAFPDGQFDIPVRAVKATGDQSRLIAPQVSRSTRYED